MLKNKKNFLIFMLYSVSLFLIGMFYMGKKASNVIIEKQQNLERNQKLFMILDTWMEKKQRGKNIAVFLKKNAYYSIAIYGLGNIGKLLESELKGQIDICYGIDKRNIMAEIPVYKPEDDLPKVDMVIVTPVYGFEEIEEMLRTKLTCPIYSIEDIIYYMG